MEDTSKSIYFSDLEEYLVLEVIACNALMVPGAGIEPARYFYRGILSPLRLPISPPGLSVYAVCRDPFGVIRGFKGSRVPTKVPTIYI